MATRKKTDFDWPTWFRSFGVWGLGIIGVLITFYFTTTATLKEHERQFIEVGKKFDQFNSTQKQNYEDYAKNQKEEQANRQAMAKEFQNLLSGLSAASVKTQTQVETIGKQLDGVTNKLEGISTRQQENRQLIQQRR